MRVGQIGAVELQEDAYRLNAGFFLSEDEQAMRVLRRWSGPSSALHELTVPGGVFSGPIFRKISASGPDHGMAYVSAKDILKTDIRPNGYLSYKHGPLLDQFRLRQGTILLTCSGMNLGRSIWVRSDMEGLAGSGDLIRIVPDERAVAPGYLFAFVSSRYGRLSVRRLIYGGHIKHVSPADVGRIQAPRLGDAIERKTDGLIKEAATLRTQAAHELTVATRAVAAELELPPLLQKRDRAWWGHRVSCSELNRTRRFEGYFHNPVALRLDDWISRRRGGYWRLGDVADVFDVPPFKHIYVGSEQGLPFYTSGALFRLERSTDKYLSRTRTKDLHKYVIKKGWVLLARSGQLGGIIGRPQLADSALHETTTSDHVIRIVPRTELITPGFLYAYLATEEIGYPLLTRTMTGASVPALWPSYLNEVRIVKARRSFMEEIDGIVQQAIEMRIAATVHETDARRIVEQAIEEAA